MKYTPEETETIGKVKNYLKAIRTLNKEKFSLELELKEDIPLPQSIKYSLEMPGGYSKSKSEQITSRMVKRDLITKRLKLFNKELDKFMPVLYLLNAGHRNILAAFVLSRGYTEMLEILNEYCITESSYKRKFPEACLSVAKYLDLDNPPSLESLNEKYFEMVQESEG